MHAYNVNKVNVLDTPLTCVLLIDLSEEQSMVDINDRQFLNMYWLSQIVSSEYFVLIFITCSTAVKNYVELSRPEMSITRIKLEIKWSYRTLFLNNN